MAHSEAGRAFLRHGWHAIKRIVGCLGLLISDAYASRKVSPLDCHPCQQPKPMRLPNLEMNIQTYKVKLYFDD